MTTTDAIKEKQEFKYFRYLKTKKTFNFGNQSYTFYGNVYYDIDKFPLDTRDVISYIIVRNLNDFEIIADITDINDTSNSNQGESQNYKLLENKVEKLTEAIQFLLSKIDQNSIILDNSGTKQIISSTPFYTNDDALFIPEIQLDSNDNIFQQRKDEDKFKNFDDDNEISLT